MACRIVTTGAGVISAAGEGLEQTYSSLISGRDGISTLHFVDTIHKELPCGEVPYSNEELKIKGGIEPHRVCPRSSLLGVIAAMEAASMAHLQEVAEKFPDLRIAFLNGTTVAGMDITEQHYKSYFESDEYNRLIALHLNGAETDIIVESLEKSGIRIDYVDVISTACSAAANAIAMGADLIKTGRADIVIAGGSEAISKYHLNGFNSLLILDGKPCRPFDASRAGLNLGEGAGFIVLESEEVARKRGASRMAYLSGYANTCDAYHQTASSPDGEGAALSMSKALQMSGLQPQDIDYINAHGTGTQNNDLAEGIAIQRVFKDKIPPVCSTKAFTGHPTSAAAGVEAVICLLSIARRFIPANLRFTQKDEALTFAPVSKLITDVDVRHVLSNSFGFGGNDTTLIFSARLPEHAAGHDTGLKAKRPVYINAAKAISIQEPFSDQVLYAPVKADKELMRCKEPDFKPFVSPMAARRMAPVIKRTIATSQAALKEADIENVEAVITGTGIGCFEDTHAFLKGLIDNNETLLQPSRFISSTPNTIGSQIAIILKCNGINTTHVYDKMAFDSALTEAVMLFEQGAAEHLLLNAADEMPQELAILYKKAGADYPALAEGSVSFVLESKIRESTYARLDAVEQFRLHGEEVLPYSSDKQKDTRCLHGRLKDRLDAFLAGNGVDLSEIDAIFTDDSPGSAADKWGFIPEGVAHCRYKRFCGEYMTASAYGMFLAANILKRGELPAALSENAVSRKEVKRILCLASLGCQYTFVMMSKIN